MGRVTCSCQRYQILTRVLRRAVQLVTRLHVERRIERVDIRQRDERAIHARRVGIGQQLIAKRFVPLLEPPDSARPARIP